MLCKFRLIRSPPGWLGTELISGVAGEYKSPDKNRAIRCCTFACIPIGVISGRGAKHSLSLSLSKKKKKKKENKTDVFANLIHLVRFRHEENSSIRRSRKKPCDSRIISRGGGSWFVPRENINMQRVASAQWLSGEDKKRKKKEREKNRIVNHGSYPLHKFSLPFRRYLGQR